MEQKAIKLSERFFETMVGRYAQAYRETGNVLSLVDTILEAITESIMNSGISLKIKHDFECYFFDSSNIPNRLKISQTVKEDGMTPISFELKEGSNRFQISEKKVILEVKCDNILRKVEYQAKKPQELVVKDYYINGKKKEARDVTVSTFDAYGYEQHRLNKTIVIANGKTNLEKKNPKTISEVSEWYRNPEHQEQVIVTECEICSNDGKEEINQAQTNIYYLEPKDMHLLDDLYHGNGLLMEDEQTDYYDSISYLFPDHKMKELKK